METKKIIPRCQRVLGVLCEIHKRGQYIRWSCGQMYSPEDRRKRWKLTKKLTAHTCEKCSRTIYQKARMCRGCNAKANGDKRRGVPLTDSWYRNVMSKNPFVQKGSKHPQWKGNKVGYSSLHKWMVKTFGNPSLCAHCGLGGISIKNRWNIHWANKTGLYKRKKSDWLGLCPKCHARHEKTLVKKRTIYTQGQVQFK